MIQNNNHDKVWITKQRDHIDFELKHRKSVDDLSPTLCKYYWLLAAGCLQFSFPYFHLQMLCVLFGQLMFQKWMGTNCETNDKNHARTHRVSEFVCSLWKIRFFNYVASFMRCTDLFMICTVIVFGCFSAQFSHHIHSFSNASNSKFVMNHFHPVSSPVETRLFCCLCYCAAVNCVVRLLTPIKLHFFLFRLKTCSLRTKTLTLATAEAEPWK